MRAVLFDLDGVIYQDGKAIDGAVATLHWVLEQSIPHLFVTNTTSRPRHRIAEQLQDYDLDIEPDRILTPPIAACHWLCRQQTSHIALFVPEATRADFADFHTLDEDTVTGADAVILGDLGEAWDFARLNRAFRLLQAKPECALLALGMTRYWRAPDGLRLDTGPFVRALEFATEKSPVVLGKPAAEFFHIALQQLDCKAGEALMVGDDIRSDIAGAQQAGLRAALVRTGKFREADLSTGITPDTVLDSIADMAEFWQRLT